MKNTCFAAVRTPMAQTRAFVAGRLLEVAPTPEVLTSCFRRIADMTAAVPPKTPMAMRESCDVTDGAGGSVGAATNAADPPCEGWKVQNRELGALVI